MPVGEASPDLPTDAASGQREEATVLPKTQVENQLVTPPFRTNPRQW